VPLRIRPNPFWGARMEDIFRGRRAAAAPATFTATVVTTSDGSRSGAANCGQGNSGYGGVFDGHHPYGLRGTIRYQSRFKPHAENRTFP
jgi:hypothetical protein